jgi:general secretion pathway protein J
MRRHGQAGFTLAEAMIAVAILALIGVLTYSTFSNAMDARDQAMAITQRYHQIRQAMQRMATEISMAFITAHKGCDDPRTETAFVGKRSGNGMRLDFNSFSHFKMAADANESDQNELSYWVGRHPDDPDRTALMRREQARIDEEPDEGGIEQILAEDVTSLEFEFYDAKEDDWEDEWDTTSTDQKYRMPMFVSIRMKALGPNGEEETFVTKTRIFLKQQLLITGTGFSRCID